MMFPNTKLSKAFKYCQSGEISPNLVTLNLVVSTTCFRSTFSPSPSIHTFIQLILVNSRSKSLIVLSFIEKKLFLLLASFSVEIDQTG